MGGPCGAFVGVYGTSDQAIVGPCPLVGQWVECPVIGGGFGDEDKVEDGLAVALPLGM